MDLDIHNGNSFVIDTSHRNARFVKRLEYGRIQKEKCQQIERNFGYGVMCAYILSNYLAFHEL